MFNTNKRRSWIPLKVISVVFFWGLPLFTKYTQKLYKFVLFHDNKKTIEILMDIICSSGVLILVLCANVKSAGDNNTITLYLNWIYLVLTMNTKKNEEK